MKRKYLIAGNWKMHMTREEACSLAREVAGHTIEFTDREVLIAPPFTALSAVAETVKNSPVQIAGQNVCWEQKGPFTGEISPAMLQDCGASGAIIGHSERRQLFLEDDSIINSRILGALKYGLRVIFCIGETLEEREEGKTFSVLEEQIRRGVDSVSKKDMEHIIIAYEPVWAIGTGKTATTDQAQEAHAFIRNLIEKIYEKNIADHLRILYGGSVKPANVDELMAQPDIDGALVGGAALDGESFGRIINFT